MAARRQALRPIVRRAVRGGLRSAGDGSGPPVSRLTISGTGFVLNGQAWVPYGMSDGHHELTRVGDEALDAAMGATSLRTVVRTYGTYGTGYQQDMQEEGQPGNLKPAYLAEIVRRLTASRAAGMRNGIANDSNKGQGAEASGGNDFFSGSVEGNRQKALFIGVAVYLAQNYGDLIDWMEPLVEPNSSVVASAAVLQAFQEEFMTAVLAVAPHMLFAIGPRDYSAGNIANAIKAAWLVPGNPFYGHVYMTCNFLDNLSMDEAQRVSRAASVAAARATAGVPAWIDQIATHNNGDPTNVNLDATMALLDAASGGPIGLCYWERVSMAGTADGLRYLSDTADSSSVRLTHDSRIGVVQAHFTGVPYWMTAPAIVDTPTEGELVTYTTGTAAGRPAPTLTARVRVNGVDKGDAASYVLEAGDVGLPVVIRQTATNTAGVVTSDSAAVNAAAATTVLSLGLIAGQIATPNDYSGLALTADMGKRIRNIAPIGASYQNQGAFTVLDVQSLTRTSNTTAVVLNSAPGQNIATGMRLQLRCLPDATFDADNVVITVTNSTHFSYPNTGSNGSPVISNAYDVPASVICSVPVGAAGHPTADFYAIYSSRQRSDLNGTYDCEFPGSAPDDITVAGPALSNYTPGGDTFTLVINSTDTTFFSIEFTGVPTDGTFRLPVMRRTDHSTGFLRPDAATFLSRFACLRTLDSGIVNNNSCVMGVDGRPLAAVGLGMTVEDMVEMCNELGCDLWYVFPQFVTNDYIDDVAALIDSLLDPALHVYFEHSNEVWNSGSADIVAWHYSYAQLRAELQAVVHGMGDSVNEITSITAASNVVTVQCARVPPFASGATVALYVKAGDAGYDTDGAVCTVSGNNVSFTVSGSGTGTCSFTQAALYGDANNNLLNDGIEHSVNDLIARWHCRRTYEIGQRISTVFGGLNTRARMVLMWQQDNFSGAFGAMRAVMLPWAEATYGVAPSTWLYAIGGAAYPKAASGNTTTAQVKTSVLAAVEDMKPTMHEATYLALHYGLHHFTYEGAPDLTDLGSNHSLINSLYDSANYKDCEVGLLNMLLGHGVEMHCEFQTSMGDGGADGGLTWHIARTLADDGGAIGTAVSERLKGMDQVLLAAPPASDDINALPGTLYYQGGSTYKDDLGNTFTTNGMRQMWNASSAMELAFTTDVNGTIDLTIWGKVEVGAGSAAARIYLDGTLQGTLTLFSDGTAISTGTSGGYASPTTFALSVTPGYHLLKLDRPSSAPTGIGISKVVGV